MGQTPGAWKPRSRFEEVVTGPMRRVRRWWQSGLRIPRFTPRFTLVLCVSWGPLGEPTSSSLRFPRGYRSPSPCGSRHVPLSTMSRVAGPPAAIVRRARVPRRYLRGVH